MVLGTSTSGVLSSEDAFADRDAGRRPAGLVRLRRHARHVLRRPLRPRRPRLARPGAGGVDGLRLLRAKTFIDAGHLIAAGLCDAAVLGGVDTLCRLTLRGFAALELVSPVPCRPCDAGRTGISIGEAAGFALLERGDGPLHLLGAAATSDGYHMSSPHPAGAGADRVPCRGALAIRRADGRTPWTT